MFSVTVATISSLSLFIDLVVLVEFAFEAGIEVAGMVNLGGALSTVSFGASLDWVGKR